MLHSSLKPSAPIKRRPWDGYEKDITGFKLSKEQILRKKKLLISKNNILVETDEKERASVAAKALKKEKADIAAKRAMRKQPKNSTIFNCYSEAEAANSPAYDTSKAVEGSTVLDVLDDSAIDEDESYDHTFDLADTNSAAQHSRAGVTAVKFTAKHVKNVALRKNSSSKVSSPPLPSTNSEDLSDIVDVLRSLTAEMKYYETVTGRQGT